MAAAPPRRSSQGTWRHLANFVSKTYITTFSKPETYFFRLPPELRNDIYRRAIISDYEIVIRPRGAYEPGLLCASKRIRQEAIAIFYAENRFCVSIGDYDPTALVRLARAEAECRQQYNMAQRATMVLSPCPSPNWGNLMDWMRLLHGKEHSVLLRASHSFGWQTQHRLITAMTDTVVGMRDLPWDEVHAVLQQYHPEMKASNALWR